MGYSSRPRLASGLAISSPFRAKPSTTTAIFPFPTRAACTEEDGRTKSQLQDAIVEALKNRAIEPQVVVSVVSAADVADYPGRRCPDPPVVFAAFAAGRQILNSISRAGGTVGAGRGAVGHAGASGASRHVAVWRATLRTGQQYLDSSRRHDLSLPRAADVFGVWCFRDSTPDFVRGWRISLAEAVAKAGGLVEQARILRRFLFIAVKPARPSKPWVSTHPNLRDRLFRSSIPEPQRPRRLFPRLHHGDAKQRRDLCLELGVGGAREVQAQSWPRYTARQPTR